MTKRLTRGIIHGLDNLVPKARSSNAQSITVWCHISNRGGVVLVIVAVSVAHGQFVLSFLYSRLLNVMALPTWIHQDLVLSCPVSWMLVVCRISEKHGW